MVIMVLVEVRCMTALVVFVADIWLWVVMRLVAMETWFLWLQWKRYS